MFDEMRRIERSMARRTRSRDSFAKNFASPFDAFSPHLVCGHRANRTELKDRNKHANAGHFPSLSLGAECGHSLQVGEEEEAQKGKRGRREFSFLSRRATIVSEMLPCRERKVNWITAAAELRQLHSKAASASLENGRLPFPDTRISL